MQARNVSFRFLRRLVCISSLVATTLASAAGSFPTGSYVQGPFTLKFERNGAFRVTKNGSALVEGTYLVKGDQLKFTDKRGPFACTGKGQATGTYDWSLQAKKFNLRKVEDTCVDRAQSFAHPWEKK